MCFSIEFRSNLFLHATQPTGLLYDDLIPEENELARIALSRMPPQEYQERLFRFRRALNLSSQHSQLDKAEWTTDEKDVHYLQPLLKQAEDEKLTSYYYDRISENPYKFRNKA